MKLRSIKEENVTSKRVLVRCDFNCPLSKEGEILNDYRIQASIPTIEYLLANGAKIILMSHLGKPKGEFKKELSLTPIQEKLFEYLDVSIAKAPDCIGKNIEEMVKELQEEEILLLENLRFHKGEEENDEKFAQKLAKLGEIYVNDAFSVSHRNHASVSKIQEYLPSYAGLLLEKEVENLTKVIEKPKRPLVAVFGGAKIETKLPAIKRFLEIADFVLVGGKIAFEIDFSHPKLVLPLDYKGEKFDIGEKTIKKFKKIIKKAKTIIWNGPLGFFEKKEFEKGTKEIAKAIADSKAFSVAGGGETLMAIFSYKLEKKFSFLSTGGGAMLDFLAGKEMPGLTPLFEEN